MAVLSRTVNSTKAILKTVIPANARYRRGLYRVDPDTRRFIRHNADVWNGWNVGEGDGEIIVDLYNVPQTLISYSYFLNILARKLGARIKSYSTGDPDENLSLRKVYESFNVSESVRVVPTETQAARAQAITQDLIGSIRTKRDVYDLTIEGIWIGIDVYESYLARYKKPTLDLNDPRLPELVKEAVGIAMFWLDYFNGRNVAAVVVSHDCYIEPDILCKVAYQKNVPVYLPNIRGITFAERPFSSSSHFPSYRQMFSSLSAEEQQSGLTLAKRDLERRFNGEVGVGMPYSTRSAFQKCCTEKPVLRKSDNIKVLITSHCFYDNPHAYGGMLFPDFYEWLRYLGKMSERTPYDWYLKVHPDPLPGTEEVIDEILAEFPRITVIPPSTSHLQLIREGIEFVLTCYGSIGHEYPAFGVQVINAGYNPRVAYDFNWHPRSIEEYEDHLLNLGNLRKEINLQELYEFYYMYHHYVYASDLFLDSYWKFLKEVDREQQEGAGAYGYFLDRLTEAKHQEIIANVRKFIDSRKRNYFSRGPE